MMTMEEASVQIEGLKKYCEDMADSDESGSYVFDLDVQALDLALTALRPVRREQIEKVWNPCNFCAGAKYITGGVTAIYPVSETRQQETLAEGDFDFCPVCGRPLTDEAVEMVMERLEGMYENT